MKKVDSQELYNSLSFNTEQVLDNKAFTKEQKKDMLIILNNAYSDFLDNLKLEKRNVIYFKRMRKLIDKNEMLIDELEMQIADDKVDLMYG